MPPIAWIVLAMIWFGMSDTTVIFTVMVPLFPIVLLSLYKELGNIRG